MISYELFPPRVPDPHSTVWAGIVKLLNSRPDYVSVTFGALGSSQELSRTVLQQVLQRTGRTGRAHPRGR
ncbi:methylenetetrahydrofolate reductase [Bowdeniella nasicola]|uniref:methylenetetrahydrofolate reductase n=1 Tax=Bowdeniella nasicola TaxID=208480 RepID=UPI001FE7E2AE|nr:methylenetetrahydrofolate reductase [Bowdeniella nasicola]